MKRFLVPIVLLALAACQLQSSDPPAQTPTLTITPASVNVNAGDAPVTFVAAVQNSAEAVTWVYTGPGSIAPSAGPVTSYTPPTSVGSTQSGSLVATLGSTGVTAVAPIAIYPADVTPPPDPPDPPDPGPNPDPGPGPDPDPPASAALTVTKVGSGTVTSSPAGIDCGGDCEEAYPEGTEVTLAATPDAGWAFGGWSDGCSGTGSCAVTMNDAKVVTATFTALSLPAPVQLSPADGTVFNHYPRTTTLAWDAVPGASSYMVEVEYEGGGWSPLRLETVSSTTFTFDFVGAQPGRWRVWAVGSDGTEGEKSAWWEFEYTI